MWVSIRFKNTMIFQLYGETNELIFSGIISIGEHRQKYNV